MRKIMSFVRLDLLTIKPYGRSMLLLVAIGCVMGIAFQSVTMLSNMFMIGILLVMSYPFAIAEKNGSDRLYATLALSRAQVVRGRYLFVVLVQLMGVLATLLISALVGAVAGIPLQIEEMLLSLCILCCVLSVTVCIQYLLFFKMGYTKAKLLAYLPMVLLSVLIGISPRLFQEAPQNIEMFLQTLSLTPWLYVIPVLAGWVLLAVSRVVSCALYAKRDL